MTSQIFADLHNHTTASDGDFAPDELLERAKQNGLAAIAVTDHDTLGGIRGALEAGEAKGIRVIPGVEVSIRFKRPYFTGTLHLLCYFKPERLDDTEFIRAFEAVMANGRGEGLVRARIDQINAIFGPAGSSPLLERDLVFEDISVYSANASRRHFALALSERLGITDKATINDIIGNDSPAYLPSGVDLADVAAFIKERNLTAVLAHPAAGSFPGEGHYKEVLPPLETVERILPEFIDAGIRGIEVYYPGHADEHVPVLLSWAKTHGFFVTGGSDCHDDSDRPLAQAGISEALFNKFTEALS